MLKGKHIVLCVTGGIAVYKAVDLVSKLKKLGAYVEVVMTKNAEKFVTSLTFETISASKVYTELSENTSESEIAHIVLAQRPDLILIAPATANIIGKVASGIADDLLSTLIVAKKAPVIFVPAMNTAMFENKIVQSNIEKLLKYDYIFIEPSYSEMAMKEEGEGIGRFPETEKIIDFVIDFLK